MAIEVPTTPVTFEAIEVAVRGAHGLHAADVVRQPGLDFAAAGAGEEAQRLALQVVEDLGAKAVHDLLADRRRQPRLQHPEDRGGDGDAEHAGNQPYQQADILVGERVVDQRSHEERRCQRNQRRRRDQQHDGDDRETVGGE